MQKNSNLPTETIERLLKYQDLVLKWNNSINLIGKSTQSVFWHRHILDCLQLNYYLNNNITLVDVGSGAGLPGIVLSILGVKNVILIEANEKKSFFLLQAAKLSDNNITILNNRVEEIIIDCDVLVSRAFKDLNNTFALCRSINTKKFLLPKGVLYLQEIEKALEYWSFDYIIYPSITNSSSNILEINNVHAKNNRGR